MGQALYRKYRSKSLDEIVGQEHITHTLQQAVKSGRISHAYLFTGPRGVGKTSIARILAHDINQLPYTDDSSHMDIIEIDAASNRRIDEIRELRDKVYVAPTSAKYKVYIIDEVHMLTKEAFNALLKTLEEPPAHVVFILATTDAHKLPETIVSRTQRFSFKPVPVDQVVTHLKYIAQQEKLQVSDEAFVLLAEHGEGSFRDSISLLDQASNHSQPVEADDVRSLLGIPPETALQQLLELLHRQQGIAAVAQALSALYDQGYQAAAIAQQLARLIRRDLVGQQRVPTDVALQLLTDLLAVPTAHDPERYLEIVLLRPLSVVAPAVEAAAPVNEPGSAPLPPEPPEAIAEPANDLPPDVEMPVADVELLPVVIQATPVAGDKQGSQAFDDSLWPAVLSALKQHYNTLYGVVRMAQPTFGDGELTLAFSFAFHQKRVSEARNQQILVETIRQLTGEPVRLVCIVDKAAVPLAAAPTPTPAPVAKAAHRDELSNISNIFGSAELLES